MTAFKSKMFTAAAAALLTMTMGVQSWAASAGFSDLGVTAGKEKIISLKEQGLIKGMSDTSFAPDAPLTAAQGIQLISGGLQLSLAAVLLPEAPRASALFSNVKDNVWYTEAFINAHYNDVQIRKDIQPAEVLTREEFTYYLMQAVEKTGSLPMINIKPAPLADEAQLEASYQGGVLRALHYKIAVLDAGGKFRPKSEITRAEAAVMVYNAVEFLKAKAAEGSTQP